MHVETEIRNLYVKIVGDWYSPDEHHKMVFHLTMKTFQRALLTTRMGDRREARAYYALHYFFDRNNIRQFYIETGALGTKKYLIKSLSERRMELNQMIEFRPVGPDLVYRRKIDLRYINDVLTGIDFTKT